MTMINCAKCSYVFSNLRYESCPVCHPKITRRSDLYALPLTQRLILGAASALAIGLVFTACQVILPSSDQGAIACMLEARAQAKAAGNPNFKYAKEVSPDRAMLVFGEGGRTWEANYFCN